MQEKKEKSQNRFEVSDWLRVILAYGMAVLGIFVLTLLVVLFHESWVIGFWSILIVIPLFPAVQTILLRKKQAKPVMFLKIYLTEKRGQASKK